ncbi:DNA primase, partial [bacterium]
EEVKERASIVQVISEYVPLKKRGANYIGLCPFHSEKTPSFSVNEEKKIFYCFGCNAGGNVIAFLMKKDGVEFPDAVRTLASRFGVRLSDEKKGEYGFKDALYHANKLAAQYFADALRSAVGAPAREYLKKRGFQEADAELLRAFGVGFAPDAWSGLSAFLAKNSVSMELAVKAGLVVKREEKTGYYDRFRSRLIFPITDVKGRVVGFGGRSMANIEPKYLNSADSDIFKKGATLYGLQAARSAIAEKGFAVAVEGYFDLLQMHRHGFTNSVATMGTALTAGHVKTLKGYANCVYALFDTDIAGKAAAVRALDIFLEEEVAARIVLLPFGAKDPDELLSKSGKVVMQTALDEAEPLMVFYLRELQKKIPVDTPENKTKYLSAASTRLSRVKSVAERGHYASFVAGLLGIPAAAVFEAVGKPVPGAATRMPAYVQATGASLVERTVLRIILKHPEFYDADVDAALRFFTGAVVKEAAMVVAGHYAQNKSINAQAIIEEAGEAGGDSVKALLANMLLNDGDGFMENPRKMLNDSLKKILNKGKLKASTELLIKSFEELGHTEAGKMRQRAARGRKPSDV